MKTKELAHKWIANLFVLLLIVSFSFLSIGLANAGLGSPSLRVSAYVTPSEIERGSSGELKVTVTEVRGEDWAKDVTVTSSISPLDGCTISPSSKSTSRIGESSYTTFHFTIYASKDASLGKRSVSISVKYYDTGWLDVGTYGPYYSSGSTEILVKKGHGSISVSSSPSGAKVYIDGSYKGTTPLLLSVEEGKHAIKLTKEYYYDAEERVSVKIGETTYVSKTLKGYGFISVDSNPSGAKVYLDGDYKGETPLSLSKVVVGSHTIKLIKSGYADITKTIHVSPGKTTHVSETLPLATRLLASVFGIIVLIIVIIGIFVTRRKKKAKPTVTKAEETTDEEKIEEVKIPEPEEVRERLRETYPEKDAARLANAFRIVQDIRSLYCTADTTVREINKEFDLLKMYLTEREFLDEIGSIQERINAELREDERLDEKHVEEVKDFCEKFTEMWIAKFLR